MSNSQHEGPSPVLAVTPMEPMLQYAPPVRARAAWTVIPAGLLTTAVALLAVWWLGTLKDDINIMGWYANYVLPVGAVLVGLVAGSGYGIAAWRSGFRVRWLVLMAIAALQIFAYFAAQYIEFRDLGLVYKATNVPVPFWEYFDIITTSFAWQDHGKPGAPLGKWGYAFKALEVGGFVLGGLIIPLGLLVKPYCELCRAYMKTEVLATLPATAKPRKVKKKDPAAVAAFLADQDAASASATALVEELVVLVDQGDARGFRASIAGAAAGSKAARKLPARVDVSLVRCQHCSDGFLTAHTVTGQGNQVQRKEVLRKPVTAEFVRAYALT